MAATRIGAISAQRTARSNDRTHRVPSIDPEMGRGLGIDRATAQDTDLIAVRSMAPIAAPSTEALGMDRNMVTNKAMGPAATEQEKAREHAGRPRVMGSHGSARSPSQHIFKSGTYARQTPELH
jgi:hypothetical protein